MVPVTVTETENKVAPVGVRLFRNQSEINRAPAANTITSTGVIKGKIIDLYARVPPLNMTNGSIAVETIDEQGKVITLYGISTKQNNAKITVLGKVSGTYYVKVYPQAYKTKFKILRITVR